MRFMMTISADKHPDVNPVTPELMEAIGKFSAEMAQAGILLETGGYLSTAQLRLGGGKVAVTDGPYTEAKELVGGYAIVQVPSKEEAIALGQRFLELHARYLGPNYTADAEIRQLLDPGEAGPAAAPR